MLDSYVSPDATLQDASDALPVEVDAQAPKSWRDRFPVHSAADLFPMMSDADLDALGEDIRKHGLRTQIFMTEEDGNIFLLDGRNRLDAMERAGVLKVNDENCPLVYRGQRGGLNAVSYYVFNSEGKERCDPYKLVISANIHRRHLTAEDKRRLIDEVLAAQPHKSNRQIASEIQVSPTTVGKRRAIGEAAGDVSTVDTRTDTKGRQQPAHKSKPTRQDVADAAQAMVSEAQPETAADALNAVHEIMPETIAKNVFSFVSLAIKSLSNEEWPRFWEACVEENKRRAHGEGHA